MSSEAPTPAPAAVQFSLRACCVDAPRGAGLDNKAEAYRLFREDERRTVNLIDHENARRFLRSTAFELLRDGELPGERVHEIYRLVIDPETHKELQSIITKEN